MTGFGCKAGIRTVAPEGGQPPYSELRQLESQLMFGNPSHDLGALGNLGLRSESILVRTNSLWCRPCTASGSGLDVRLLLEARPAEEKRYIQISRMLRIFMLFEKQDAESKSG